MNNLYRISIMLLFMTALTQTSLAQEQQSETEKNVVSAKQAYLEALQKDYDAKAAEAKKATTDSDAAKSALESAKGESLDQAPEPDASKASKNEAAEIAKELAKIPTDGNSMIGDILKFKSDAYPFVGVYADETADLNSGFCAPKFSKARVTSDDGDFVFVNFKSVATPTVTVPDSRIGPFVKRNRLDECKVPSADDLQSIETYSVVTDTDEYKIRKTDLNNFGYYRRGFTFGGLVIPFKYYMGGDRRVSGSATLAPYIGWRGPDVAGVQLTPTFSAGLAFVPINTLGVDDMGNETSMQETKTAFSVSGGLMLSSPKNKAFSAGIMIGRDRLSSADRRSDPTAGKTWISVFAGIKFNGR